MALINARNGQLAVTIGVAAASAVTSVVSRYWNSQDDTKTKKFQADLSAEVQALLEQRLAAQKAELLAQAEAIEKRNRKNAFIFGVVSFIGGFAARYVMKMIGWI